MAPAAGKEACSNSLICCGIRRDYKAEEPRRNLGIAKGSRGSFIMLGSTQSVDAAQRLVGLAVVQYELGHFGGRAGIVAVCKASGQCQVSAGIGESVVISCIRPLIGSQ